MGPSLASSRTLGTGRTRNWVSLRESSVGARWSPPSFLWGADLPPRPSVALQVLTTRLPPSCWTAGGSSWSCGECGAGIWVPRLGSTPVPHNHPVSPSRTCFLMQKGGVLTGQSVGMPRATWNPEASPPPPVFQGHVRPGPILHHLQVLLQGRSGKAGAALLLLQLVESAVPSVSLSVPP